MIDNFIRVSMVDARLDFTSGSGLYVHSITVPMNSTETIYYRSNATDGEGNWMDFLGGGTVVDIINPVAVMDVEIEVNEDQQLILNGTGSYDNIGIVDHVWKITSYEHEFVFRGKVVNYSFEQPGEYSVSLKVTVLAGNSDMDTSIIHVIDIIPPHADAGADQEVRSGTRVTFNGSGSFDNVRITNLSWTFQHGEDTIDLFGWHPDFTFVLPGTFKVTMKVQDGALNVGLENITIIVKDMTPPIADAGLDQIVQNGSLVILNGSGSSDNIDIVNWTWGLTYNGTEIKLFGAVVEIRFDMVSNYNIELVVKDAVGNIGYDETKISVTEVEKEPTEETETRESNFTLILLILIFIVLAVILVFLMFRMKKKRSPLSESENVSE
jgi:PKD repeat protein